jgi:DNA-cytosine methyltransferase
MKIVLSLFNGMGCGSIVLENLNVEHKYYYSEIDRFANHQQNINFPYSVPLGDITKWQEWDIEWRDVDLILAGSPCQGFSFAGKQLNFSDERSRLFFVFVDILNHVKKINPEVKFLLENVNMKKEYMRIISEYLGIFPVNINSNRLSAQNRNRWYWTNIRTKKVGLFDELYTDIPQPEDKGILLKDILQSESEVDEKYYLTNPKMIDFVTNEWRLNKKYTQINGYKSIPQMARQYQTWCGDYICVSMVGRKLDENGKRKDYDSKLKAIQRLEPNLDGKTNCLTSVQKDNLIFVNGTNSSGNRFFDRKIKHQSLVENGRSNTGVIIQKGHGFNKGNEFHEKSPTLLGNSWEHNNHVSDGYKFRRLTPTECARLQTIPEWYIWDVSETQQYKMLGNGWTCDVIEWILSFYNNN